jgi:N-dimethylarginine dimethylaminohydrolase
MRQRALVRRPGPRLADGLVTHIARTPVDGELALRQWQGYVDALQAEGWETIEVPAADDCPDAVFVEDTVVVHGDLAVLPTGCRRAQARDGGHRADAGGPRLPDRPDRGARDARRR